MKKTLAVIIIAIVAFLYLRNSGSQPQVLADEAVFSWGTSYQSLGASSFPNLGFFLIYKLTNQTGNAFYEVAKSLNLIFYFLGIFFIYKTALLFTHKKNSFLIAVLSSLFPGNYYTGVLTPESLYFAGFWILVYQFLSLGPQKKENSLILGACCGGLALIKPHACFLLFPLIFGHVYKKISNQEKKTWGILLKESLVATSLIFIGFTSLILVPRLFLKGIPLMHNITGADYSKIISSEINISNLLNPLFYFHMTGEFLFLIGIYGIFIWFSNFKVSSYELIKPNIIALQIFSFSSLVTLISVSAFFVTSISETGPYENHLRIATRLLFFLMPCFLILFFKQAEYNYTNHNNIIKKAKYILLLILVTLSLLFNYKYGKCFLAISYNDSPDIYFALHSQKAMAGLFYLSIVLILLLLFIKAKKSYFYIYTVTYSLLFLIPCNAFFLKHYEVMKESSIYDIAGRFGRDQFMSPYILYGTDLAGLYKAGFYERRFPIQIKVIDDKIKDLGNFQKKSANALYVLSKESPISLSLQESFWAECIFKNESYIILISNN